MGILNVFLVSPLFACFSLLLYNLINILFLKKILKIIKERGFSMARSEAPIQSFISQPNR